MGEGGRPGVAEAEEVLVEEVLVGAVAVFVDPDVGEGAAVGVLRVADARNLQLDDTAGGEGEGTDREQSSPGRGSGGRPGRVFFVKSEASGP